jgi:DNA cross-link repair 1A protein
MLNVKQFNVYLQVDPRRIREIRVRHPITVLNCIVSCVPANHCPGAVMFIFATPGRSPVLHSGDCRYHRALFQGNAALRALRNRVILHLDTTYCSPEHTFPLQQEVVEGVVAQCVTEMTRARDGRQPPPLFVFGSYTIGKEPVFLEACPSLSQAQCRIATNWTS